MQYLIPLLLIAFIALVAVIEVHLATSVLMKHAAREDREASSSGTRWPLVLLVGVSLLALVFAARNGLSLREGRAVLDRVQHQFDGYIRRAGSAETPSELKR